jgi:hypothetical protein
MSEHYGLQTARAALARCERPPFPTRTRVTVPLIQEPDAEPEPESEAVE